MNTLRALILTLACAGGPLAAVAQDAAPSAGGPPPGVQAYMTQSQALHEKARAQMLGALTPSNRSLLASLVSQLSVADQPDVAGAIQKLNAALSPSEQQAVLSANVNLQSSERALRDQLRAQMPAPSASGHGGWQGHGMRSTQPPDAGSVLLHMAAAPLMPAGPMGMGGPMSAPQ